MEEQINFFKIVHVNNKSKIYHITQQVLLNAIVKDSTYSLFYHILTKEVDDFNYFYGSFACLIVRNSYEADLYLNVNNKALKYIIEYVQTGQINSNAIYLKNCKLIDEIINLATIFGFPDIVSELRNVKPSPEYIDRRLEELKKLSLSFYLLIKYFNGSSIEYDNNTTKIQELIDNFFQENRNEIIEKFVMGSEIDSFNGRLSTFIATILIETFTFTNINTNCKISSPNIEKMTQDQEQ